MPAFLSDAVQLEQEPMASQRPDSCQHCAAGCTAGCTALLFCEQCVLSRAGLACHTGQHKQGDLCPSGTRAGEKGNLWAFNFFFYNRKAKKIAYFSCRAISKTVAQENSRESSGRYASYSSAADHGDEGNSRYGMAGEMDV